ncbi:Glycosyltransferase like family 2 [Georgenia satyanarayanai]|uniref:Glycosyltransferase like family 2 n=1 Tax=Georgenia satyanarayanai TaxID=860221 RepID=A0A2Y9C669_9MICO|nr:glycosyl transferase family 2 [Georgenia satyanarayanai]SSA42523.1 Glycosyltransferase like family 2 [Georgenia satyanarayanai]
MPHTEVVHAQPRVSVVVPVRDDPRLSACLEALSRQSYPAELVEVIVADNGDDPAVRALVDAQPGVRYVAEPEGGSYTARNAAVLVSTGEVLAFTDADCLPEPQWLTHAVRALADGADIVAGRVRVYARDAARPHPVEAYELVHAFPQETYVSRSGASVTANMCTTRAAFDAAGPFRSELLSGADIEWAQRANGLGLRTVYCAHAVVHHPARDSYAALRTKLRRVIAGRHERNVLDGHDAPPPWPAPRALVPPLGAVRRARQAPQLPTARARAAFLVGEVYHRYVAAWVATELAFRDRLRRRRARAAAPG